MAIASFTWRKKATITQAFTSRLDGGSYDALVPLGIEVVEYLDVDWVSRNIYFADPGWRIIAACDLHGTTCTVFISDGLDKQRGIAVHPQSRMFLWSDWRLQPHIPSAGMEGSDRKEIINRVAVDDSMN